MQGKIFNYEGPVFKFLNTAANIVILSVAALICSIPVITFGPSMKALCSVCLKMVRNEEGYVLKDYFKSFKVNFWQTVVLGLIVLAALGFLVGGIYSVLMIGSAFHIVIKIAWGIAGVLVLLTMLWIFPMQSRFINPINKTLKFSIMLVITRFPKTLLMLVIWLFIPACFVFISGNFLPLVFLAELGTASYFCAEVYDGLFAEMEERIRNKKE